MAGLLIIAHAPLATSLQVVGAHVYPDARVAALDVSAETPRDELERRARRLLATVRDPEAIILTDVFGATPCNIASQLTDGVQVKLVAGVNVPMLWRVLCYLREPLDMVVARALAGATQGVLQVGAVRPQNQSIQPAQHDQGDPQDQQ
jgi:PTS system ascorbate-specific IIA component